VEEMTETSIWNKKQEELTVGESMKIAIGVGVVATVAPFVIIMAVGGAAKAWEKFRNRKNVKLATVYNDGSSN
jgi:flagellar basal body-associated protein FliL